MKLLLSLVLLVASFTTNAFATQFEYDLKVEGMKCAFCAYNVSKQLESLDGVVWDSVDVDLEQGRVRLQSNKELINTELVEVLLQAGFKLATVSRTEAAISERKQKSDQAVLLSVTMNSDRLSDGQFDAVLEALGAIAADRSGRVSIVAPVALETAILKPILVGRKTVIRVDFDQASGPDQTVVVSLSTPSG